MNYIKGFLAICLVMLLSSCTEKAISDKSLFVQITNYKEDAEVVLVKSGMEDQVISIDENGEGSLKLADLKQGYTSLYYGPYSLMLWMDPTSDITVSFDGDNFAGGIAFEGSDAEINDYLNNSGLQAIMINDCALAESDFIAKADSLLNENLSKLNEAALPADFVEVERNRVTYFTYSAFNFYPEFHSRMGGDKSYTVSDAFIDKVKGLLVMDDAFINLKEYKDFVKSAVSLIARKELPDVSNAVDRNIEYVEKNIDNELIAEFLINNYVYSFVKRNGIEGTDKYMDIFNRYVKNEDMRVSMDEVVQNWKNIEVGMLSPDFVATDINGKEYRLDDFKGKFVYIDVWATWCGPCKKEAPFIKEFEERYEDKDIYIVSLSCDADREAWEKHIVEENKEGIQIILDSNSKFLEDYMIVGIPHFLLLDKEGRVMNSKMSRPSDPETKVFLDGLLN